MSHEQWAFFNVHTHTSQRALNISLYQMFNSKTQKVEHQTENEMCKEDINRENRKMSSKKEANLWSGIKTLSGLCSIAKPINAEDSTAKWAAT